MISDGIERNKKFFSYQFIAKAIDDTFENFGMPVVELGLIPPKMFLMNWLWPERLKKINKKQNMLHFMSIGLK
jgi:hypothetical protein